MISWGISADSHDAALAVFNDNSLVFASEAERFSRIKNDRNLHDDLVDYASSKFGWPQKLYWYEKPILKSLRQFKAGQGFVANDIQRYLKSYGIVAPINYQKHHRSHAAAGYFTSTFDNACIVVIDAIGEFETLTLWRAAGHKLTKLYTLSFPHSVGLWYSAMTQRCGLKPNEEEYILMGMAALGDPAKLQLSIQYDFFDSIWPIKFKKNLHRGCKDWRPDLTSQQDIYDIAATTQRIYETIFSAILACAREFSHSENLVLIGGCALNCAANPIAFKHFENVWIMPAPGDAGSAIGAVLSAKNRHIEWPGPYLGYDLGYTATEEQIVDYLIENKICGVARGKAEFGPRALGNRSLLADPRGQDIKDKVNELKHREQFRPFAPAILQEHAGTYFDMPTYDSPYMQYVARCKKPDEFPAIVHFDNTSRVQTVGKNDDPRFRKLLEVWYERTGCPMLLNTSLNIKGEPMVNNENDVKAWSNKYNVPIFS